MKSVTLTPGQIRAARALLDWSRHTLADKAGVSVRRLASIESRQTLTKPATMERIFEAFRKEGICFSEQDGVKKEARG